MLRRTVCESSAPKRLGLRRRDFCHGTKLGDFIGELDGVTQPVCIIGAIKITPRRPAVQEMYRKVPARMRNVEVHIFPGVEHGYMMPGNPKAFSPETRKFSMDRALAILGRLRG